MKGVNDKQNEREWWTLITIVRLGAGECCHGSLKSSEKSEGGIG